MDNTSLTFCNRGGYTANRLCSLTIFYETSFLGLLKGHGKLVSSSMIQDATVGANPTQKRKGGAR